MLMRIVSVKALAVFGAVVLGGGVAAAATGSLPGPIQSGLASVASHVGLSLPRPASTGGGGVPGNLQGQCTAYAAVSNDYTNPDAPALRNSTAFRRLEAAAAAQGESVQAYCLAVTSTSTTSTSTTSTTTTSTSTTTTAPTTTTVAPTTTTTTTTPAPSTTLPANAFGQCNAYSSVTKGFTDFSSPALAHSTAFQRLEATAAAQGESVQAYCAPILGLPAPSTTTTTTTPTTTTTIPSGKPKHGKGGHGGGHGHGPGAGAA